MAKKKSKKRRSASRSGCGCGTGMKACCQVESVVSIDERGQMVLPKEVRKKAGIKPGDKLAVVTWGAAGCCSGIVLLKSEELEGQVKKLMGPMFK